MPLLEKGHVTLSEAKGLYVVKMGCFVTPSMTRKAFFNRLTDDHGLETK